MGIPFPSTEVIRDIFSYDGISASFSAFEAARIDRVMHPEGSKWNWTLAIAAFLGSSLALWRLWTFTVRPWMYADEAKEIPYWVPCESICLVLLQKLNVLQDLGIVCLGPVSRATRQSELKIHGTGHAIGFFRDSHGLITRTK